MYALNNNVTYFNSFRVEHIPKEIKKYIDISRVVTNIFRIQAYDSRICNYFCIELTDFMFAGKNLTESPSNFNKKYDKISKC